MGDAILWALVVASWWLRVLTLEQEEPVQHTEAEEEDEEEPVDALSLL